MPEHQSHRGDDGRRDRAGEEAVPGRLSKPAGQSGEPVAGGRTHAQDSDRRDREKSHHPGDDGHQGLPASEREWAPRHPVQPRHGERLGAHGASLEEEEEQADREQRQRQGEGLARRIVDAAEPGEDRRRKHIHPKEHRDRQLGEAEGEDDNRRQRAAGRAAGTRILVATRNGRATRRAASSSGASTPMTARATRVVQTGAKVSESTQTRPAPLKSARAVASFPTTPFRPRR